MNNQWFYFRISKTKNFDIFMRKVFFLQVMINCSAFCYEFINLIILERLRDFFYNIKLLRYRRIVNYKEQQRLETITKDISKGCKWVEKRDEDMIYI